MVRKNLSDTKYGMKLRNTSREGRRKKEVHQVSEEEGRKGVDRKILRKSADY